MQDPGDGTRTETLRAGPSRPSLFERLPARWRRPALVLLVFVLGVAAGAGAVLWRQGEPARTPVRSHEHAVELVLFQAQPSGALPNGDRSESTPLHVDGALLMSGGATSEIFRIDSLDRSLDVRIIGLPMTISPTHRFQPVVLELVVRDCQGATRWEPTERPFDISWRDEHDQTHLDRAGDFDTALADSMLRYVDAVCDD